jgi:Ohr subfamily peroxiredoxin
MIVLEKVLYTAHATSTGGRDGHVKTDDGRIDLDVAVPAEMGGKESPATNPEQLFAAGYAACFGSAVAHVARAKKINAGAFSVTAHVDFGPTAQSYGLAVKLDVHFVDLPIEQAQILVEAAHQICPYSNATRGNIAVSVAVV